jgi:hypothetical protein
MTLVVIRTYVNFNNQKTPNKIARLQIGDELGTDFIFDVVRMVFPLVIDTMFHQAKEAGLPPRGRRCVCLTAGTTHLFMATLHEEDLNDPTWTMAACFQRASTFQPSDFGFAHPGLDGGRGLVMQGSERYLWAWKGSMNVHAGVVSKNTAEAVESGHGTYNSYLTTAVYQKRQPLNFGHRYLRGPPTDARVWLRRVEMQNSRHSSSWMACIGDGN